MTSHFSDLYSASVWLLRVGNLLQPIRSNTQFLISDSMEFLRSFLRRNFAEEIEVRREISVVFSG